MAKANQTARYFFKSGVTEKEIAYKSEKLSIVINIPTNYQNDMFMAEFTNMRDGEIQAADLIQARLIRNIVELPFEIPRTLDIEGATVEWKDATDDEKINAVGIMDPALREGINAVIIGETILSESDTEN